MIYQIVVKRDQQGTYEGFFVDFPECVFDGFCWSFVNQEAQIAGQQYINELRLRGGRLPTASCLVDWLNTELLSDQQYEWSNIWID